MTRLVTALSIVTALMLSAAPASARTVKTCWPKHTSTVDLNPSVRVYSRNVSGTYFARYYACDLQTRNRKWLGASSEHGGPANFRIAGDYVGFVYEDSSGSTDGDYTDSDVYVVGMRRATRRSVHYPGTIAEFLALPNGGAAWIGRQRDSAVVEVHLLDAHGDRLLDSGGSLGALAMSADIVYWTHDGAPRSASASAS